MRVTGVAKVSSACLSLQANLSSLRRERHIAGAGASRQVQRLWEMEREIMHFMTNAHRSSSVLITVAAFCVHVRAKRCKLGFGGFDWMHTAVMSHLTNGFAEPSWCNKFQQIVVLVNTNTALREMLNILNGFSYNFLHKGWQYSRILKHNHKIPICAN